VCVLDLVEREHRVNHWLNRSAGQQRHNFSCEVGSDGDLLLERSRAQHCAGKLLNMGPKKLVRS